MNENSQGKFRFVASIDREALAPASCFGADGPHLEPTEDSEKSREPEGAHSYLQLDSRSSMVVRKAISTEASFGDQQEAPWQSSYCNDSEFKADSKRRCDWCSSGSHQQQSETYGTLPVHSKASSRSHPTRELKRFQCRQAPAEQAGVDTRAATNLMFASSLPCRSYPMLREIDVSSGSCTNLDAGQLTILYDGNINVYDDVTLPKFQEIMLVAAGVDLDAKNPSSTPSATHHVLTSAMKEQSYVDLQCVGVDRHVSPKFYSNANENEAKTSSLALTWPGISQEKDQEVAPDMLSAQIRPDVPRVLGEARKLSFIRFLQQRKDRLASQDFHPNHGLWRYL